MGTGGIFVHASRRGAFLSERTISSPRARPFLRRRNGQLSRDASVIPIGILGLRGFFGAGHSSPKRKNFREQNEYFDVKRGLPHALCRIHPAATFYLARALQRKPHRIPILRESVLASASPTLAPIYSFSAAVSFLFRFLLVDFTIRCFIQGDASLLISTYPATPPIPR